VARKKKEKAKPDYSGMLPAVIPPKKVGRPELISPELANEICLLLLEGYTIRQLTARENMPAMSTLMRWAHGNEESRQWFREQYARARMGRAWVWADEILDIADDGRNDWVDREVGTDKEGDPITIRVVDHEHIMRSKIRIDTRKFLMAKFLKDVFGKDIAREIEEAPLEPEKIVQNFLPRPDK